MKQHTGKFELSKMPGFDILERLPEEQILKSYNEEYYNTLSSVKMINVPIENDHRLFYHFEQNANASISTTTGQLLVKYFKFTQTTYEEAVKSNLDIKKHHFKLREETKLLRGEIENVDKNIHKDFFPEIMKMKRNLQSFLVEQKTENFKLIKEIAILEKEKSEIQNNVYVFLNRMHKVERDVGIKAKAFT